MKVTFARFLRDLDQLRALRGKALDLEALYIAVELLAAGQKLPAVFSDHPLHSDWMGFREFHIGDDDLVIYQIKPSELVLRRAGTHRQLFRKSL